MKNIWFRKLFGGLSTINRQQKMMTVLIRILYFLTSRRFCTNPIFSDCLDFRAQIEWFPIDAHTRSNIDLHWRNLCYAMLFVFLFMFIHQHTFVIYDWIEWLSNYEWKSMAWVFWVFILILYWMSFFYYFCGLHVKRVKRALFDGMEVFYVLILEGFLCE